MAGGTVLGGEVRKEISCLCGSPVPCMCRAGLAAKKCKRKGRSEVTQASLYAGPRAVQTEKASLYAP